MTAGAMTKAVRYNSACSFHFVWVGGDPETRSLRLTPSQSLPGARETRADKGVESHDRES